MKRLLLLLLIATASPAHAESLYDAETGDHYVTSHNSDGSTTVRITNFRNGSSTRTTIRQSGYQQLPNGQIAPVYSSETGGLLFGPKPRYAPY